MLKSREATRCCQFEQRQRYNRFGAELPAAGPAAPAPGFGGIEDILWHCSFYAGRHVCGSTFPTGADRYDPRYP